MWWKMARVASSGLRVGGYELRVGEASEDRAVSIGKVEQEIRWRMGRVVVGALERVRRPAPAFGLKGGAVKNAMENRLARGGEERLRVAGYELRVAGCGLRVASCELRVASCGLRVVR